MDGGRVGGEESDLDDKRIVRWMRLGWKGRNDLEQNKERWKRHLADVIHKRNNHGEDLVMLDMSESNRVYGKWRNPFKAQEVANFD